MTTLIPVAVSPLRQRLIDEMDIRRFGFETQRNYIRDVGRFATFLGRSPATTDAQDEPDDTRPPCPCCGGHMLVVETFERQYQPRAPPVPAPLSGIQAS